MMVDTMESLHSIDLDLIKELKDKEFREIFFDEISRQEIADQIRSLRLLRQKKQSDFVELCDMKQSAISRLEKPDYGRWNYQTLARLAAALDARIKVELIPAEIAIKEFLEVEDDVGEKRSDLDGCCTNSVDKRSDCSEFP
jgi:transcriptional regulator with XRE-family HTH domain